MAQFKTDYLLMVPEFDGNQNNLAEFLNNCETLIHQFYRPDSEDFQNKFIIHCLKNKIKGKARDDISTYTIDTWAHLKAALITTYADKRDLQTLTIELCSFRQNKLSPIEFFNKIQANLNLQIAYCNNNYQPHKAIPSIENAQALALRVFLKNLNRPLGDYVTTRNPNNLQEALHILTNDFQINDKFPTNPNSQKHNINPQKPNFQRPQTQQQFNHYQTSRPPIPNQHNSPQQFNQNFIRPNVPRTNIVKNTNTMHQPRPTPMSICTQSTRNQHHQPGPTPMELYNISEQPYLNDNTDLSLDQAQCSNDTCYQGPHSNIYEQPDPQDNFFLEEASMQYQT